MRTTMRRAASILAVMACAGDEQRAGGTTAVATGGSYIYVFAGDAERMEHHLAHAETRAFGDSAAGAPDFLAVIDADSASPTYTRVVATVPVGVSGAMPHHTEMVMPPGGRAMFANAFMAGRTYRFDFSDPRTPRVAGSVDSVPGLRSPHSYARLDNGDVVATFQFGDGKTRGDPGGIAQLSPDGTVLRTASSADPAFPGAPIRTYSLDVSEATDRIITTSSPMAPLQSADVVQVWRLSDLSLIRTLALPKTSPDSTSRYPFEVRFLADGRSAILNTYNCGFYLLSGLEGEAPVLEPVLALSNPRHIGCGVPLLVGHWWIMPIPTTHEFVVYDLADPRKPRRHSVLAADSTFESHWMSREPGTDRIVVSVETKVPSVRLVRFDSTTGTLRWDETFRDTPDGPPGVRFDRVQWPHGGSRKAYPHGAVFSRPAARSTPQ
jgi:hypothetical protein